MAACDRSRVYEILESLLKILKEEDVFVTTDKNPVVQFLHPPELEEELPIRLKEEGTSLNEIEKILQSIVRYSVKTSSPHFHNQLYGAVDEYGIAGAWLTEALNTSQYTYEVAPVFTLMEREVIERSLELIGFPRVPEGDGIFCPGGSISNMYGMVLARYAVKPDVKTKGLFGIQPLACFTSEAGHYSITKGAHWLGLGTESIYQVKTDELGRMDPQELKKAIAKSREDGRLPFFVNATAGTTVLGSFDPLSEISAICKAEGLWLHVDTCLGGTLLLSRKYRDRLKGIELTNSVAWNPHKMLGAPFQCSLFLVKGKDILHKANSAGATYLFQQDKFYDVSWDTGDKSVQCGRKVDAAKFWLMWKARGSRGFESLINKAMGTAEYFFNKIQNRKGFRLVLPKFEGNVVCFWYIPPSMRGLEETEEWKKKLHTIAPKIKEKMILDGSIMIGYTPLGFKNYGNFLRMVVTCQPPASHSAMDFAIEQIEKFGADL